MTLAMAASPITDDLQDLSPEDAQELRAFLHKRRWFEGKLEVLEALPPIYPFVHPSLAHPGSGSTVSFSSPVYLKHDAEEWRLPSEEEVRRGQTERDALEEEILAFDGGDLMRMKQKTRAATLLPLTPPSTHLVSITLALIVVIDRLLTLLRHRAELLELTSMRLQWDNVRWQIMQETERVRSEIDDIASGKGRWAPPVQARRKQLTVNDGDHTPTGSPVARSATLPPSSSASSSLSAMGASPAKLPQNTSTPLDAMRVSSASSAELAASNTPKRPMQLPLLRSNIASLEIRQRNLAATAVTRSGKLLDKIIDVAIPLKNLGGVVGPGPDGEGGAVPDELLDIQDELEGEVAELEGRVSWCRGLELQCGVADKHYLASARAKELAQTVLDDLISASSEAPVDERHQMFTARLSIAREALPTPTDATFPSPSHPSYPQNLEHTARLLGQLGDARSQAAASVSACEDALVWYAKLVTASQTLATSQSDTERSLAEARAMHDSLTVGVNEYPRPRLDDTLAVQDNPAIAEWLRLLPERVQASRRISVKCSEHAQQLAVAVIRYRQIARAPPKAIREQIGAAAYLDIVNDPDQLADTCQDELARLATAATEAEHDGVVLASVQAASATVTELRSRIETLREHSEGTEHISEMEVSKMRADLAEIHAAMPNFMANVDRVYATLRSQNRSVPPLSKYVDTLQEAVCGELDSLSNEIRVIAAVLEQSSSVAAIEAEAEDLIQRIETRLDRAKSLRGEGPDDREIIKQEAKDIDEESRDLQTEVKAWTNGLTDRVRLVTAHASSTTGEPLDNSTLRQGLLMAATTSASAPPMTPPASPPVSRVTIASAATPTTRRRDPAQCDHRARLRVNEASSRVNGRLAALQKEIGGLESARKTSSSDVFGAIATVPTAPSDDAVEPASASSLLRRLNDLQLDSLVTPTAQALQQTPTYRQIPSSPRSRRIREELKAVRAGYDSLRSRWEVVQADDLARLGAALEKAEGFMPKLDRLVAVSQAVKACDESLSRILDALDVYTPADREAVQTKQLRAEADIDHLRSTATVILDDARVAAEVKRTETSWDEMKTLVAETIDSIKIDPKDSDAASATSSVVSMTSQTYRQPLSRPSARTASNPVQPPPRSLPEPRNRAASDTPSRIRLDGVQSGLPRLRKASIAPPNNVVSPVATTNRARPSTPSSIPRPSRLSNASTQSHTTPTAATASTLPRTRKTSRLSAAFIAPSSNPRPRKTYVADPKNKLDVAVGRIVNKLKVNVPIRPVGADAADEWKDQSGKYWIGAEGRAKLCFCRILRSKTVMVRVGGGWVELSKFLQDHFADSFAQWDSSSSGPQVGIGAMGIGSATPIPITSASLSQTTPLRHKTSLQGQVANNGTHTPRRPADIGITPGRTALAPRSSSDRDLLTPQRQPASPEHGTPPLSASKQAANGPGTPLVPLHFIRKASESPEVRQMEREKLITGKRSILGRSHSGNVLNVSPEKETAASPGR